MRLRQAALEDWLRDRYFAADIDISSSGVHPYSMPEFRAATGMELAEFDAVSFRDSRSCGDERLREVIAKRWAVGDSSRVMATHGSSEALFLVMNAMLQPDDDVVVVTPAYHSLDAIAAAIGCRVRPVPLRLSKRFQPDLDELASLVTAGTRMLVVNFPHNPTGGHVDAAAQRDIVAIARRAGAYLVWDAAFADLVHDGPPLPDAAVLYERAISFGTLSKAFGLPGLRVGWCIAPPSVLAECVRLRDYTTLALSPVVELIALRALQHAERLITPRLAQAAQNLGTLAAWAAGHPDQVALAPPGGGVVAFPRLAGVGDVTEFCQRLMARHSVLLVPGACFGEPDHVRIGFGVPPGPLAEGLGRISELLAVSATGG